MHDLTLVISPLNKRYLCKGVFLLREPSYCETQAYYYANSLPPAVRPGSEAMYGFSEFACGLNQPEEGVAPTDSRLRPDQRVMENGDFDTANSEKVRRVPRMTV